jgi:hypothetical protein
MSIGIPRKKTIVVPCRVKNWLKVVGGKMFKFGAQSWSRIMIAAAPPRSRKSRLINTYRMPIRL